MVIYPSGSIIAYAGDIAKTQQEATVGKVFVRAYGWLVCDGSKIPLAQYPQLYAAIGNIYNRGDEGDGYFRLPDYRGYFLRMVDAKSGRDPDLAERKGLNEGNSAEVGKIQEDALQTHVHEYSKVEQTPTLKKVGQVLTIGEGTPGFVNTSETDEPIKKATNTDKVRHTAKETRPKNMSVYYLIKV